MNPLSAISIGYLADVSYQISFVGIPSTHHMQTSYGQTPRDKKEGRERAKKEKGHFPAAAASGEICSVIRERRGNAAERASDGIEQPSKLEGKDAAKASRLLSSLDLLCRGFEIPPSLLITPKHLARSTAQICCKGMLMSR